MRSPRASFPGPARWARKKKAAALRPAAAAAGTEPKAALAARARRERGAGPKDTVSALPRPAQARARGPVGAGRQQRAHACAVSPRLQLPPTQFHALLPAPFSSREGRAVARGSRGSFAAPPLRRRSVSPSRGGAGQGGLGPHQASPPQHSAQERSVETLRR